MLSPRVTVEIDPLELLLIQHGDQMKVYIALFRAINLAGRNTLPMKELVSILEDLGARNVRTYIQSGNAVFVSPEKNPLLLSNKIRREIKKRRGFEPQVLLLEANDLEKAVRKNPFTDAVANPSTLHAGFLAFVPEKPNLKVLESLKSDTERFRLIDKVFYLHAPDGIGRSKLAANAEKRLGVPMTDRNWRTVCNLREMVQDVIKSSS